MIAAAGQLQLESLNNNSWLPHWHMNQILEEVVELFAVNPLNAHLHKQLRSSKNDDGVGGIDRTYFQLLHLSKQNLQCVMSFLSESDIRSCALTCKQLLQLAYDEEMWATLYYQRIPIHCALAYQQAHAGPLRVWNSYSNCIKWEGAREGFIRGVQAHKENLQLPSVECFAAAELATLLPLSTPQLFAHLPEHRQCHPQELEQEASDERVVPSGVMQQVYFNTLRYRCARSLRLARWLGGRSDAFLRRYLAFFRWNVVPLNTLQFLCDVSTTLGTHSSDRASFRCILNARSKAADWEMKQHQNELGKNLISIK